MQYLKLLTMPGPVVWVTTQFLLDKHAKTSMFGDLSHHQQTEIEYLNGHAHALGQRAKVPTPVNEELCRLVRAAEAAQAGTPNLSPAQIAENLKGAVDVDGSWLATVGLGWSCGTGGR